MRKLDALGRRVVPERGKIEARLAEVVPQLPPADVSSREA